MRLTSIVVCSMVLAGLVLSQQTAYAQAKDAGKQQAKKAATEQTKKTEGVGEGKYSVWVFKMEEGKWVKQPDRTLNTDDAKEANDYVDQVKTVEGWTANTNAPPPAVESVVGAWVGTYSDSWQNLAVEKTFYPDGRYFFSNSKGETATGTWTQNGHAVTSVQGAGLHPSESSRFSLREGRLTTTYAHPEGGTATESYTRKQ